MSVTLKALATVVVVSVACWGFASPSVAEAQVTQVESNAQGAVGLGLVGAELGFVIPAAAGLHELWAFIVFPVVGAAGGAVGGYFAFDNANRVEGGVAMLATGMALVIPSLVLTLVLTAYDPEDDGYVEEDDPPDVEASEEEEQAARIRRLASAGSGILRLAEGELLLGAPAPSLMNEVLQGSGGALLAATTQELHVPLVSGSF